MIIVISHSMYGLRDGERSAARRLAEAGHDVVMPDLFAGRTSTPVVDEGFRLMRSIGWDQIVSRGRAATEDLPEETALVGFSMGVGVMGELWPDRPRARAVVCWHAPTNVPTVAAAEVVQLHAADNDPFTPAAQIMSMTTGAAAADTPLEVYRYPSGGHFFTDPAGADWDEDSTQLGWRRALEALSRGN